MPPRYSVRVVAASRIAVAAVGSVLALLPVPAALATSTVAASNRGLTRTDFVELPEYPFAPQREPWMLGAGLSDVDGDGVRDFAGGLTRVDDIPGSIYVVSGAPRGTPRPAAVDQRPGFRITVPALVPSLVGLDDVNGDGLGEIAVASPDRVFVVFGKSDAAAVDVEALGDGGFTIDNVDWRSSLGGDGFMVNQGLVAMGDQNGDGREDLAVADGDDVKIVYTPAAPAGKHVDADALGTGGAVLSPGEQTFTGTYFDSLGDLDGDGRTDLALGYQEPVGTIVHLYGAATPAAGETRTLDALVTSGKAFALDSDDATISWLRTVGDQNGDGRRELTADVTYDAHAEGLFAPKLGTRGGIADAPRYLLDGSSNLIDVGDQDGNGRADIGGDAYVYLTRDTLGSPSEQIFDDAFYFDPADGYRWAAVIGTIDDENGDGRPELLVGHVQLDERSALVGSEYQGRYAVERWDSAPVLIDPSDDPPDDAGVDPAGGGTQWTAPAPGSEPPQQPVTADDVRPSARTEVMFPTAGLRLLGGSRRDRLVGGAGPDRLSGRGGGDLLLGLAGDDTLLGGPGSDALYGGPGRDLLLGGRGRDRLFGGPGNDRIVSRDGVRDRVYCGPGNDRVVADRRDVLIGC